MSKIQDALGKIQANRNRPSTSNHGRGAAEEALVVAKVIDRGSHRHGEISVSDKILHVDSDAMRKAGLIAPEYDEQLLANQYRDIKRPIIGLAYGKKSARVKRGNLIMVSSALSGEGKTFTSINLALSMARERDYSVVLVDADVAKPHVSEMFGAEKEQGLLDALEDPNLPVQALILPTDVQNLSVLPAGQPRAHSTELLASAAMEQVCATIANLSKTQIVIFDSPPILQTSEAKVLAGLAGQIVIVVRAEKTSHEAVTEALASLDDDKAINLILNQARVGRGDFQYGYGQYGYGSDNKQSSTKDTEDS